MFNHSHQESPARCLLRHVVDFCTFLNTLRRAEKRVWNSRFLSFRILHTKTLPVLIWAGSCLIIPNSSFHFHDHFQVYRFLLFLLLSAIIARCGDAPRLAPGELMLASSVSCISSTPTCFLPPVFFWTSSEPLFPYFGALRWKVKSLWGSFINSG